MTVARAVILVCLLAAASCGEAEPVPEVPTWAEHVEPLLRGNCFHCHGATANTTASGWRFDVFDADQYRMFGIEPATLATKNQSAKTIASLIPSFIAPAAGASRMPPPPALPLSDRERELLEKWSDNPVQGRLPGNRPPGASWITKLRDVSGRAVATVLIVDPDHQTTLGRMICGDIRNPLNHQTIMRNGAIELRFPAGTTPPCEVTLFDGEATSTITLR